MMRKTVRVSTKSVPDMLAIPMHMTVGQLDKYLGVLEIQMHVLVLIISYTSA